MKKVMLLLVITAFVSSFVLAQTVENFDFISSFHNDVAAVKKDGQWAFINEKGELLMDFRSDLVVTKSIDGNYPVFNSDRCLIVTKKEGISYYGYIDKTGKAVIEPQFLNATHFKNGAATVLELVKEIAGRNELLDKNVVYYKYFEAVIDSNGKVIKYLTTGTNVVLNKKYLKSPPRFKSKKLFENLYAILNEHNKWTIIRIIE